MHVRVILNPQSDLGRAHSYLARIAELGDQWDGLEIVETRYRNHARELAVEAAENGCDLIVAAGGDGTVHEVVNGVYAAGRCEDVVLGVVPIGSGNDFAFGLGLPQDVESAVARLFEGTPKAVDLARVESDTGRVEVLQNNFGIGLDARVVIHTEAVQHLHGFVKYFYAVLKTLAVDFQTLPLEMVFDGERVSAETTFITFGLGPRHGGGFLLTPDALQDDGLVDTCDVASISRMTAVSLLKAAVEGTHITHPKVTMRQNRVVVVSSAEALPIHIDGEIFASPTDNVHQVTVTVLPKAVRFIC